MQKMPHMAAASQLPRAALALVAAAAAAAVAGGAVSPLLAVLAWL